MSSLKKLSVQEPKDLTPAEFFGDHCPKVLQAQKVPCAQLGGRYGFRIFGERGGAWTLDFATAEVQVGLADKVDLYLEMDDKDFFTLVKGSLDVVATINAGRIRIDGDPKLLGNLAAVLQPGEA
jgi:alkyl sulfatase BDS1-like metallo-beta-lactamase superfamily hydrolase